MRKLDDALALIKAKARPDQVEGMARFGISPDRRLGLSVPDMRRIAKTIGRDHRLAQELWSTGIPDARIVAAMIDEPARVTESQMDRWVAGFDSWDVCDQVCMNLFDKSPLAWKKVADWSSRAAEFEKRAAFTLIACLAWHDKSAPDDRFLGLLPLVVAGSTDERNYVKKAVSWALRHIGKRNTRLNKAAVKAAREIATIDSRAARLIAAGAIRELTSDAVRARLAAR